MSDDLKKLKVDDKWSISYDSKQNDRPLDWYRYDALHTPFSGFNADVAIFYALKEASDRIEEFEKALANMQREYDKRGDRINELKAKLAKAVDFVLRSIRYAGNSGDDFLADKARATLAKINGEQP